VPGSHAPQLQGRYPAPAPPAQVEPLGGDRSRSVGAQQWQANATSLLGSALCVGAGVSLAIDAPVVLAAALFSLGGLCDLADGMIARAVTGRSSVTGALIDSVCDKVGEFGLLIGLALYVHEDPLILALLLLASGFGWLTSYAKPVAAELGLGIVWSEARVFGRAGRAVILSTTLLAVALLGAADTAFALGFGVLLVFNSATFLWRLVRMAKRLDALNELR
jgi:phosphatidylglycerophosphate synthase